jgi:hypothetical protein
MGYFEKNTGSYVVGILIMAGSKFVAAGIIFFLGLGKKSHSAIT